MDSDNKLTSKLRQYILEVEAEKQYISVINDYKSHIAPSFWEHKPTILMFLEFWEKAIMYKVILRISMLFGQEIFWVSMQNGIWAGLFIQKMMLLFNLCSKHRATQLKAEIKDAMAKGITLDTEVEQQYKDVEMIREKLNNSWRKIFWNRILYQCLWRKWR
jgi:hypothetical protein